MGAYHLEFEPSRWLTSVSGGALGPNPFMLILLVLTTVGAVIAAAVPLLETTILLYNPASRTEVRLTEGQGYSREPTNIPGRVNKWVAVSKGAFESYPAEIAELRAQRSHHVVFLAVVAAVGASQASKLLGGGGGG